MGDSHRIFLTGTREVQMYALRLTLSRAAIALLVLCLPAAATAQQKDEMPEMTPQMEAEMVAWMQLAQPGSHHEHLAPFVGTWKGEVTMWMAPDTPPITEQSLAEVNWILGGRYLQWKQTGEFGGMPFEGLTIEGYNNGEQRYESIWIDNFGTLILFYTGSCSDDA